MPVLTAGHSHKMIDNQTRAHFDDSDLISILPEEGIPELAITKLDVTMTDTGARMATEIAFESPFKISVHGLHGLGLGLAIDDETVLRMHLQDLNLEKGFQVMPLTLELDVEHALIQRDRVSRAFTTLTDQILKEDYGSILASMSGPILVKDLPTLNEMTQDLQIYLPVKKVLDSISVDDIKGFVSVDGITSVLKKSWLGLSVGSDTITVDSNLVLPPFLAIPRHISFPYTTAISVGSPSVSALAIRVDPVTIVRDDSSIHVSTKITVIPVNTIDAADALGQSINPLLAAVPRASTITLRDLGMTDGSGHRFDWTSHLFSKANLPFPLPNIICKVCVLDMLTNGGKEIPLSIPAMDVTQLESDPGFNAKGAVNIALPGWLPEIHVAIGYLDLAVTVETTAIAEAVLDGGLRFDKAQRITPLNANLYFKQSIADKIQSLVSAFMSTDHDSSAGMTGFHMGPDRSRKIVTFSRIIVEIDVTSIRDIAMMIGKGAITSLIIPDMLVVQSVDLNVPSSTKVLLGMGTALHNPTPFSLNVGSVAFDAFVDGEFMTGISLSPLSISRGLGPLNLGLDMTISKGTDILSAKIGALVRQVVGLANQGLGFSEFMADSLQMLGEVFYTIDVTHLTLSPRHNPNGHGKIDMLSPVKLSLQVSQLYALSSALIGTQAAFSPVSIAPLLPSKDNLFQLDPSIRSAALEATPHGSLEVGASVGYTNPLPISVHIPYCSATVTLGGLEKDLVIAHILGIHLSRGRGLLDIIAALKFPQTDPNMPVSFSNLLSQFLGGTISPSIGIKALSFGSGPGDVNVLLSHVAIELDFVTKHLGWIGPYALQHGQQLLELYIQEYVNENSLQIVSTASGGLEVQISNSLGLVLHDLAVNFLPSRQMSISVNTAVVFPFPVTLRLPFLRFSMGLDDFPFMDIRITGLSMNGQGSNEMSLGMHIIFHESEALTNAFNRLSTQLMKGFEGKDMLQFGSLFLGFTESDTIQTFSLVSIPLPLEPVIAILSKVFTNLSHRIDIVKLLDALGISLASLKARSLPHRTLDAGAGISFQNNFKFTLHGLGHVEANIALDKEEMIDLSSSGLNLRPGLNTIDFGANLTFHSSATLQSNVAKMFETIANSGMGNNAEIISVSGVKFGYFDSEPIGFLSGIIVSFPASYVLNKQVLDIVSALVQKALNLKMEDLRLQALMERLDIGRVNLDTTVADRILLEGQVGVKKIPTEFDIDIGFTGGFADLDTERFVFVLKVFIFVDLNRVFSGYVISLSLPD